VAEAARPHVVPLLDAAAEVFYDPEDDEEVEHATAAPQDSAVSPDLAATPDVGAAPPGAVEGVEPGIVAERRNTFERKNSQEISHASANSSLHQQDEDEEMLD
jgi:hypothetical protein